MYVLIPAYQPSNALIDVIDELIAHPDGYVKPQQIVVIDDGSSQQFSAIFDEAMSRGVIILTQPANFGKGAALKRAFTWLSSVGVDDIVVTADADGQHSPTDIIKVGHEATHHPRTIVIGARKVAEPRDEADQTTPWRSWAGNVITRKAFARLTGIDVSDTQSGLRGFDTWVRDWMVSIEGDRFDFEFNVLLQALDAGINILEVPIETVYFDDNSGSHFRPIVDSWRIYAPMGKHAGKKFLNGPGKKLMEQAKTWKDRFIG